MIVEMLRVPGQAPNVGGGVGMIAAPGGAPNFGGGIGMIVAPATAPTVAPNLGGGAGMIDAPGLAPVQYMFNIEEALEGPPLRRSEVGPFFFF